MLKKVLLIICVFFLVGCTININELSYDELLDLSIEKVEKSNINAIGYRYYLPNNFSLYEDNGFIQVFLSSGNLYYLNIASVSYHYKKKIVTTHNLEDYYYKEFYKNDKDGYIKITKNNDYFFVELCYNYAIIEVEVLESDIKYALSYGLTILNSIKYNDLVIEKSVVNNTIDTAESVYKIPEPAIKSSDKNVLDYIKENEN